MNENNNMSQNFQEKRGSRRYYSEDKVDYSFAYDLVTKMKFLRKDEVGKLVLNEGHPGFVKNVSIEGLCIISDQKLEQGEILDMEVYIPRMSDPVRMQGQVKWTKEVASSSKEETQDFYKEIQAGKNAISRFDVGIHLNTVDGKPVTNTVYYDETYHVAWSIVLESIMGRYRSFIQKNNNEEGKK